MIFFLFLKFGIIVLYLKFENINPLTSYVWVLWIRSCFDVNAYMADTRAFCVACVHCGHISGGRSQSGDFDSHVTGLADVTGFGHIWSIDCGNCACKILRKSTTVSGFALNCEPSTRYVYWQTVSRGIWPTCKHDMQSHYYALKLHEAYNNIIMIHQVLCPSRSFFNYRVLIIG